LSIRYEAVLFDLDGVVIDTDRAVTAFWQQIAAFYGRELTPMDLDQWVYGRRASETLDALFPHLNEAQRTKVTQTLQETEQQATYQEVAGVTRFLQALRSSQIPTALVTSAQRWKVEAVLEQLNLGGLFTAVISAEDIRRGKPDPEGYLRAARQLAYPASSCIVFEDAPSGVQAAREAGALCIGVRPSHKALPLLEAGAGLVIPDFTRLNLQDTLLPNKREAENFSLELVIEWLKARHRSNSPPNSVEPSATLSKQATDEL
jgi:HAD superfamily hydrolase (TIGR01509 family)